MRLVQTKAVDDNPDNLETAPILLPNAYGYDVPLDMRLVQQKAVDDNPDNLETAPLIAPNAFGYDVPLDMRLVQDNEVTKMDYLPNLSQWMRVEKPDGNYALIPNQQHIRV